MEYSRNGSVYRDLRTLDVSTAGPAPIQASVCVVGAGPAGLFLALLLAKRGVDVLVLEGHQTFDREFRGEILQPSAIGLLDGILAEPHVKLREAVYRIDGRTAGSFEWARIVPEYPYAVWMPQPALLSTLRARGERFRGFRCWMGARVDGLVEQDGKVVGVRGTRGGTERFEVRADVVVGADGRHSIVR